MFIVEVFATQDGQTDGLKDGQLVAVQQTVRRASRTNTVDYIDAYATYVDQKVCAHSKG